MRERLAGEADAIGGIARGFDDHINAGTGDDGFSVVGDKSRACGECVIDAASRKASIFPACVLQSLACPRGVEVGQTGDVQSRRHVRL